MAVADVALITWHFMWQSTSFKNTLPLIPLKEHHWCSIKSVAQTTLFPHGIAFFFAPLVSRNKEQRWTTTLCFLSSMSLQLHKQSHDYLLSRNSCSGKVYRLALNGHLLHQIGFWRVWLFKYFVTCPKDNFQPCFPEEAIKVPELCHFISLPHPWCEGRHTTTNLSLSDLFRCHLHPRLSIRYLPSSLYHLFWARFPGL